MSLCHLDFALLFFLLTIPCVDLFKTLRVRVQGCNVVVAIKRRLETDLWLETKQKLVNSRRFSRHLLCVDISGALLRVGSSAALLCISNAKLHQSLGTHFSKEISIQLANVEYHIC